LEPSGPLPTLSIDFPNNPSWSHMQYKGADKSLARPERKQATPTEDFYVHIAYL